MRPENPEYEAVINGAPEENISVREFWLMAYTSDWEGLLALYEATGKSVISMRRKKRPAS
jgi:hypothetical protein